MRIGKKEMDGRFWTNQNGTTCANPAEVGMDGHQLINQHPTTCAKLTEVLVPVDGHELTKRLRSPADDHHPARRNHPARRKNSYPENGATNVF